MNGLSLAILLLFMLISSTSLRLSYFTFIIVNFICELHLGDASSLSFMQYEVATSSTFLNSRLYMVQKEKNQLPCYFLLKDYHHYSLVIQHKMEVNLIIFLQLHCLSSVNYLVNLCILML